MGLVCLHQFVNFQSAGIALRFMFLDISKEIVRVKGAKQTAARFGVQAPYVPVVGIAIRAGPAHFHKRESVGEQCLRTFLCPVALLPQSIRQVRVPALMRLNRRIGNPSYGGVRGRGYRPLPTRLHHLAGSAQLFAASSVKYS